MTVHHRWCVAALVLALATAACSPALNWREVPLESLVALLPCKPDHAERRVQFDTLNGAIPDAVLQVSGCEAAGALYAVSHVRVTDAAQVVPTRTAWRQSALATFRAVAVGLQAKPLRLGTILTLEELEGKQADGTAIQAQWAWIVKGQDIYQVAVYGSKLDKEMTELLFSELRLQ